MLPPLFRPALTRRQFGGGVLAAATIAANRAHAAGGVTIAASAGWFQDSFDSVVLEEFRKTHPGFKVFYFPIGNSFQALTLLRAQRARPTTDIVLLDSDVALTATAEGLLDPIESGTMPVLHDLIPQALMPKVAGPALMLDTLAMGYDPAQVPRPPRSWRDLWDPTYGRRIALQTPPDPAALAMTAVASTLFGGGELLHSLALGVTALTELTPRVVIWDPDPDIYTAIVAGEAGIGPCWNAQGQNQAAQTPGKFAATIPEGGSPVRATSINLVKGGQQSNAARNLIAWLLGSDAQRLLTEKMFYAPVNAKANISNASLARAGATPEMVAKRMDTDWVIVDTIRDQIMREWRRRNMASR